MTSEDHRKACIEAIKHAIGWTAEPGASFMAAIVHGIARVNPIEATRDMMGAGQSAEEGGQTLSRIYLAMSTIGDLTNPPEKKPRMWLLRAIYEIP
jgi:hypothetical protein